MKYAILSAKQCLLAPNGEKSLLTPTQYAIVRSIPFKSWFGDWTKKRGHSVVVDKNGEPLICYHGTKADVKKGFKFDPKFWNAHGSEHGRGFYFVADKTLAKGYGKTISVFLNIRKPLDTKATRIKECGKRDLINKLIIKIIQIQEGKEKGAYKDSFLSNYVDTYEYPYSYCKSKAIDMILDDSNTIMDIIAELGNVCGNYSDVYKAFHYYTGYDGFINHDYNSTKKSVFIAWFPNQIKSIRNKTFDNNKDEIHAHVE